MRVGRMLCSEPNLVSLPPGDLGFSPFPGYAYLALGIISLPTFNLVCCLFKLLICGIF